MPGKSAPLRRTAKFDIEITVSSALIGLSNLIFDDPTVQGFCSLLSPAIGHYATVIVGNLVSDFRVKRQQKQFEERLKKTILELESEYRTASSERKSDIEITLKKLKQILLDSQMDMLEFQKPDLKK